MSRIQWSAEEKELVYEKSVPHLILGIIPAIRKGQMVLPRDRHRKLPHKQAVPQDLWLRLEKAKKEGVTKIINEISPPTQPKIEQKKTDDMKELLINIFVEVVRRSAKLPEVIALMKGNLDEIEAEAVAEQAVKQAAESVEKIEEKVATVATEQRRFLASTLEEDTPPEPARKKAVLITGLRGHDISTLQSLNPKLRILYSSREDPAGLVSKLEEADYVIVVRETTSQQVIRLLDNGKKPLQRVSGGKGGAEAALRVLSNY